MLSVIIPFHNEANIVENVIKVMLVAEKMGEYEIIVVNDASEKEISSIAENDLSIFENIRIVEHKKNMGKGLAIRTGLMFSRGDIVAIIDADIQINPEELIPFSRLMALYNADMVIGDKRHESSCVRYSPIRWVISNTYNFFIKTLFGICLRDTQCGIKLVKRNSLPKRIESNGYAFDLEMISLMRAFGRKIISCPVYVRKSERSNVSPRSIVKTIGETVWLRYRLSSRIMEEISLSSNDR